MSKANRFETTSHRPVAERDLRLELGQRITQLRSARRWTQAELARQVGVTRSQVLRWERGALPPLGKLIALSLVLETTLDALLAGRSSESAGLTAEQRQAAARHLNHLAGLLRLRSKS